MHITNQELAELLQIKPNQYDASVTWHAISHDSRTIEKNSLFIALRGELQDGHRYIEEALKKGAHGVLCETFPGTEPGGLQVFKVPSSLKAFRQMAAHWRSLYSLPVIAVVGSVGKTTSKELLGSLLSGKYQEQVLKTSGSENGNMGIPITLSRMEKNHQAAVIEIGIDAPSFMEDHWQIVRPTHSICTGIAPEHMEFFKNIETVAKEELLCLKKTAANGGKIAINKDDPWIAPLCEEVPSSQWISYSMAPQNKPSNTMLHGTWIKEKQSLLVSGLGFDNDLIPSPLAGIHNAQNLLGACAAAFLLGLNLEEILKGLKNFKQPFGRSDVQTDSRTGATVLCDYYNASPASMIAGFHLAEEMASTLQKKKIACLGDMLELGTEEEHYHRALAKELIEKDFEHVICYGKRMGWLADELEKQHKKAIIASSIEDCQKILTSLVTKDHLLLIKGSRSMKMEKAYPLFS